MTYPLPARLTPSPTEEPQDAWFTVDTLRVHGWVAEPTGTEQDGEVVVLPGLGLPAYTFPTALAVAALGWRCTVLDLPGFGVPGADATRPDVHAIGRAAARWVRSRPEGRLTLVGHSTAAQAALSAALDLQGDRADVSLVMAGPTFTPRQRRFLPLAGATLTAYRRDSLRETVILPALARGRVDVARVLRSGMRDRPDERVRGLAMPLTLTAGEADSYAPRWWLEQLATAALAAPRVEVEVLPGSHNNLFTHPERVADTIGRAAARRGLPVLGHG
ncbi:MAG: alpha/beta hydrolase [Lapillicoccus sp.]